ncbi:DUF4352 domain-containing protein [Spirillospora sp. CA-253888]
MNPNQPYASPVPPQPGYPMPPARKKGGAAKGCLIAFAVLATLFVMMGACAAIVGGGAGKTTGTPSSGASAKAAEGGAKAAPGEKPAAKKAPPKVTNGVGREYRDGKFAFTVTKVKKGVRRVGNEYIGQDAQGQFVLVHVKVANIGGSARTFASANQTLFDTQGRKFEADAGAALMMNDNARSLFENINPGNAVNGVLVFDVPRGVKLKAIELHDSLFSGGVTIPLGNR